MLPELTVYIIVASDILILLFVVWYLISLHRRSKRLEKKENAIDSNYHHVVDDALSKERQILDDATTEADQIITGAQYLTHASKVAVRNAIRDVISDIQKEGATITGTFTTDYTTSLKQLTTTSLEQFGQVIRELQTDLQKQVKDFHDTLLPEVEKELEAYKQERIKQIDQTVMNIIQKASQEIFNKSLSVGDHQTVVIQSLEKAKKEGVFD